MSEANNMSRAASIHSSVLNNHMNSLSLAPSIDMGSMERRKSSRGADSDCTMVTLLQPTQMLKSEISLHEAARKNQPDLIKKLLQAKVDVNTRNNTDRTALHWACASGSGEAITLLIKSGADIEAEDKYGMRALLWAAWFGHANAMQILVNNAANVRCTNRQGMNIIHCAAHNNHVSILQFVNESLDGFKLDAVDKNDKTPLHVAAHRGNVEAVEKLLSMKSDPSIKDKNGQTAMHLAAAAGHEEVLKKLLLVGVEVNDRDSEGKTALHLAAEGGHLRVLEALMSCTADPNAETTKEMTSLHIAASLGHIDIITALVENRCNLNTQNYQGNTALHLAAINDKVKAIQTLIDANCTIDIQNHRGMTALHCAVEAGLADATETLLIASADLEIREKMGKNALGLASRGSFIGIVDMIIKADRHHQQQKEAMEMDEKPVNNNNLQFKRPAHQTTEPMKEVLFRLATKQLKPSDWKKLAKHWKFTEDHIRAIEHQYTGNQSYHEHGYRMLLIWLHGVAKDTNPVKELFEGLSSIGRRDLAEQIRRKLNAQIPRSQSEKSCSIS